MDDVVRSISLNEQEKNGLSCIWSLFSTISRYSTTKTKKRVKELPKYMNSQMCLKIIENDPLLRLQMRAKEMFNCHQFFSTNKQYVKIKLMQNETNCWSIFFW